MFFDVYAANVRWRQCVSLELSRVVDLIPVEGVGVIEFAQDRLSQKVMIFSVRKPDRVCVWQLLFATDCC